MKTKNNAGSTIIAVVALLTVLSAFVIAALSYTGTISYNVMATNTLRRATEVGDGSLQYMFAYWRELCKEEPTVARPTSDFASIPTPSAALFPAIPNFVAQIGAYTGNPRSAPTVANYKIQATNPQGVTYDGVSKDITGTVLSTTANPALSNGINSDQMTAYYLASVDVSLPAFSGRMLTVHMRQNFQKQQTSPWQYAIFYNDLLEINPGATMNVAGWVHTNNTLYTAMNDLTFQNKVDYVSDWGVAWAPGDNDHTGTTPAAPVSPANLPPARGDAQLPFGFDPSQVFVTSGSGATDNNTGYIELIQPPDTSKPDPISNYRYYDKADVRIMIGSGNAVTVSDSSGQVISPTTYASSISGGVSSFTPTQLALYNLFYGSSGANTPITTGQSLQDTREGATMNITQLDISKITAAMTAQAPTGTTPSNVNGYMRGGVTGNGLLNGSNTIPASGSIPKQTYTAGLSQGVIYIANSTGSSTVKTGIQLVNGAAAPANGLTIVSENPVYIQGDYNTGQTASHQTPANTANNSTGSNVVTSYGSGLGSYQEASCAVLADAINVLSNAWSNSNNTLAARNATPTTQNAAFVTGIVPTGSGGSGANSYSGGAENFPRFLENWGSQTFSYYGSMVELYKSQQSTGYWGSSNVYDPPNRNWHFDTLFLTTPPPGTFTVINYARGRWYTQ